MPVSVTMPRLGESVTEGTVTRWLKQEGDRVEADEPLLEVSTDKVDTEIPAPAAGVVARIVVHEDETAEVGSELAVITAEGEQAAEPQASAAQPAAQPSAQQAPAEQPAAQSTAQQAPAAPAEAPAAPAAAQPPSADGGDGEVAGTTVAMPALGESVTEGTVTRWLKQEGDPVEADEPLLEVSTDKVDTEIPSPASGIILKIHVAQDETAAVGAPLAVIGTRAAGAPAPAPASDAPATPAAAEPPAAAAAQPSPAPAKPAAPAQAPVAQQAAPAAQPARAPEPARAAAAPQPVPDTEPAGTNGKATAAATEAYVTPLVRKLAAEQGVDLAGLSGTGVGGRIRKQDVLDAAERQREAARAAEAAKAAKAATPAAAAPAAPKAKPQPSQLRGTTEKVTRTRAVIARRMVESLQTSAQLTTVVEVDVTGIARLRDRAKADFKRMHGVGLSFLPFFALAAVEALRVHPKLNARFDQEAGTVTYHDAEHLGIAVDTERGLMVPVIHNAGDLNLAGLAKRIADLAERTRSMKLEPDEAFGGTFTLTNTGSRGALFDTPIINQPQTGILGTGTVVKRAVVVSDPRLGEVIAPRSMVYLALSYDHRLVDGADAARFLTTVKERLEAADFDSDLGV